MKLDITKDFLVPDSVLEIADADGADESDDTTTSDSTVRSHIDLELAMVKGCLVGIDTDAGKLADPPQTPPAQFSKPPQAATRPQQSKPPELDKVWKAVKALSDRVSQLQYNVDRMMTFARNYRADMNPNKILQERLDNMERRLFSMDQRAAGDFQNVKDLRGKVSELSVELHDLTHIVAGMDDFKT